MSQMCANFPPQCNIDDRPHESANTPLRWWPTLSRRWVVSFCAFLALAVVMRLVASGIVPLIPEEAYYWMYSQHPSLSYYDHPPMVAWVIGLGTAVFGNNEFGVRIVGGLMMLAASALMYRFARMWFTRPAAIVAAILLQILPAYFGAGFIATMDSSLVFFWTLGLVGVSEALRRDRAWGWYLAGIALGGALLSKYTGIFFAGGTGLAVLLHRPWRRYVFSPHPYLGLLLGVLAFSPVLIWNAQHDWASLRFQMVERFEADIGFSPTNALLFVILQCGVVTPVILLIIGVLYSRLWRAQRRRRVSARWVIVFSFSAPLMLLMFYKSLRSQIHFNWTFPLFLVVLPAAAELFLARMRLFKVELHRRRWSGMLEWTALICLIINIGLIVFIVALQPRLQWLMAFGPWKELARVVEKHESELHRATDSRPLVVAEGSYRLASVLAFYRNPDGPRNTTSQWLLGGNGLAYPYWLGLNDWYRRDIVYVFYTRGDEDPRLIKAPYLFNSVEVVEDYRPLHGKVIYHVAIFKGMKVRPMRELHAEANGNAAID